MTWPTKEQEIARAVHSGGPAPITYATLPDGRMAIHSLNTSPDPVEAIGALALNPATHVANMLSERGRRFLLAELRESAREMAYREGEADMFDDLRMFAAIEPYARNMNGHEMERLIRALEASRGAER